MKELSNLSQAYRLLHPSTAALVTCQNEQGQANIITIAWMMPVSIQPPLVAISVSPKRYSFELIQKSQEFVINIAPRQISRQVMQCGQQSGREMDKFQAFGLTPIKAQQVCTPLIKECISHVECRLVQDIEAGDHHIFVGEIIAASARKDVLRDDLLYDVEKAQPLMHLGKRVFTSPDPAVFEPEN